jgi:hypothetical protein
MLSEAEWQLVDPDDYIAQVKQYRQEHNCSLTEAMKAGLGRETLAAYERLTGFPETNPEALFHHRVALYGPPCSYCGKPLRTPAARSCAACGASAAV